MTAPRKAVPRLRPKLDRPGRVKGVPEYTPAQVEDALQAYARTGNATEAERKTGISYRTILDWRDSHAERFAAIRQLCARERAEAIRGQAHLGATTDLHAARTVLRAGMAGQANRDQVLAADKLIAAVTSIDRIARLDDATATEIVGEPRDTRPDDELTREIEAALADPIVRGAFTAAMGRRGARA